MNLGELSVTLAAVVDRFNRNLSDAEKRLQGVEGSMRDVIRRAALLSAAAAATGVAIVAGLVISGLQAVDSMSKLARQVDATYDGIRALAIVAEDAGLAKEEMARAVEMLNVRLGEAQRQATPFGKMLEDLGLSAAALGRLDADQRVAAIADRVRELGLTSQQTADLARQAGIRSGEFIEILRNGGDAIRAARQEVDEFGLSVSAVDAAKIEAANDAMERIGRSIEGVRNALAIALAPVLQEIADRFNAIVREQGGFREATTRAVEHGVRGFARVGDVVQGLRVVFKGGELVAKGFAAAMVTAAELATEAFVSFVDFGVDGVNAIIAALNKIPGVDITNVDTLGDSEFMQGFRRASSEIRDSVVETRAELHALAMEELPSSKAEEFLAAVAERAEEAAQATVQAQQAVAAAAGLEGFGVDDDAADREAERERERAERERAAMEDRLARLREFGMTELELEQSQHAARLAEAQEFLEAEIVTLSEYWTLKQDLEEAHWARVKEIQEAAMTEQERFQAMSLDAQVGLVAGKLAQMTAGVAQHSRKMFELNKAAGIANAIVATYQGAAEALKLGPIIGPALAAAQIAAGLAQVNAIKSATFGGGGGVAPSLAGGTAAPPVSDVGAGGGGRQVITLQGLDPSSLYSGKQIRGLLEALQGSLDDGAKLVIT